MSLGVLIESTIIVMGEITFLGWIWKNCISSLWFQVLLQPDPFLNELTNMFEKSTEKGSVWVTFKRCMCSIRMSFLLSCSSEFWFDSMGSIISMANYFSILLFQHPWSPRCRGIKWKLLVKQLTTDALSVQPMGTRQYLPRYVFLSLHVIRFCCVFFNGK